MGAWSRCVAPAWPVPVISVENTILRLGCSRDHCPLQVCNQASHPPNWRLGRLLAATGSGIRDGTAYLSPLLAFNLGLHLNLQPFLLQALQNDEVHQARLLSHSEASTSVTGKRPATLAGYAAINVRSTETQTGTGFKPDWALIPQAGERLSTQVDIKRDQQALLGNLALSWAAESWLRILAVAICRMPACSCESCRERDLDCRQAAPSIPAWPGSWVCGGGVPLGPSSGARGKLSPSALAGCVSGPQINATPGARGLD